MTRFLDLKKIWGRMVFRYAGRNISSQSARHSRKFYNLIGRFYDWIYTEQIAGYQQAEKFLADRYVQAGDRVLDVGCGTGTIIDLIADKATVVVGVDISRAMLKKGMEKRKPNQAVFYVVGDCRHIPLRTQFDRIVSSFMLVILPREERRQVIVQLADYLTPQGEMIFLTAQDSISAQWLTAAEWKEYCNQAGMNDVDIVDFQDYFRLVRARRKPVLSQPEAERLP